jgi:hypothetical protein
MDAVPARAKKPPIPSPVNLLENINLVSFEHYEIYLA